MDADVTTDNVSPADNSELVRGAMSNTIPTTLGLQCNNRQDNTDQSPYPKSVWGIATSFDIYDCNPGTIRDADRIREFVVRLCELIGMKRFGPTQVVHFGEDDRVAGYSMVQLIETSLISAHFANQTNTVYLDVFSCKPYDFVAVEQYAVSFFAGRYCRVRVNERR